METPKDDKSPETQEELIPDEKDRLSKEEVIDYVDEKVNESQELALVEKDDQPNKLSTIPDRQLPQSESMALLQMVERVVMDPSLDLDRVQKVIDMKNEIEDREKERQFYADLAAMQVSLPRVIKSKKGHNSNYAPLEDINDVIREPLRDHGFAVTFRIHQEETEIKITTILSHRSGHNVQTQLRLAPDNSGSKNDVQAVGSSISYGKRYGVCALLNISTGDDVDGGEPVPAEEEKLTEKAADWLAAIEECTTRDELQTTYTEAFNDLKEDSDEFGLQQLNATKDGMKKKLQ